MKSAKRIVWIDIDKANELFRPITWAMEIDIQTHKEKPHYFGKGTNPFKNYKRFILKLTRY
jgi:hypothetical protein